MTSNSFMFLQDILLASLIKKTSGTDVFRPRLNSPAFLIEL